MTSKSLSDRVSRPLGTNAGRYSKSAFSRACWGVVDAMRAREALREQIIEVLSPGLGRLIAAVDHEPGRLHGRRRWMSHARLALEMWQFQRFGTVVNRPTTAAMKIAASRAFRAGDIRLYLETFHDVTRVSNRDEGAK